VEQDDDTVPNDINAEDCDLTGDAVWGIGCRYSGAFAGGTFAVGIGYQFSNDLDESAAVEVEASALGMSSNVALDSGSSAAVNYTMFDADNGTDEIEGTHVGVGASCPFDAITLHANYGFYDLDAAITGLVVDAEAEGYGLSASYDFGGGLSAHLGYGYSDVDGGDYDSWSFGLAMSF
jgi:outer membrane protein OmpU